MTRVSWVPWITLIAVAMVACSPDEQATRLTTESGSADAPQAAEAKVPAALRAATIGALQKGASRDYSIARKGTRLEGVNAAQRLRVAFTPEGVEVTPATNGEGWTWKAAASRWGCDGDLVDVQTAQPEAQSNRVVYKHGGLDAWYVNGPLGLEQGFTLTDPPRCRRASGGGVVIELEGGGELSAESSEQGDTAQLRDPSGDEVLRYSDLYVVDATGRQLAAKLVGGPRGLSIRLDDAGAVYPIEVDPLVWTQQQELLASDPVAGGILGFSAAVSGNTAVVGAPFSGSGAAYVFVRHGNVWIQQQKLFVDGAAGDAFGWSVAVSGDTAVVGDPFKASSPGAAYVFLRHGTTWTQQQELSEGTEGDEFGYSVAISGDTAVVGAPFGASSKGAAHAFVRSHEVWKEQQELLANDGATNDNFGVSVAISKDTVAVGAPAFSSVQAAYVFVRSSIVWTQQQKLLRSDGGFDFGLSVAISGDTVVVGAPDDTPINPNAPPGVQTGVAYVFVRSGTTWTEQQKLLASDRVDGDTFGWSVAVSGDTVLIGAPKAVIGGGPGAAYVFVRSGTTWTEQQELHPSDSTVDDLVGWSVALDQPPPGDDCSGSSRPRTAVIGAPGQLSFQGAAYVFVSRRSGGDEGDGSCPE